MADKVAVVTGSNKGIGFATVKELLKREVGVVYLTSRDLKRGEEAVKELNKEGLHPEFFQLEVTDEDAIKAFATHLKEKHGGIDILINNAGILSDFNNITYENSCQVIDVNYRSILKIQKHLFPILNDNARVINIASDCGHLFNLRNKYWYERLSQIDIKVEDIDAFINWFLDSVKNGTIKKEDFPSTQILAYKISKIALCALTRIQQREVGRNISINSLHPGFVQTSMTMFHGYLTPAESAKTVVHLALDAPQSLKGSLMWYDKNIIDWCDTSIDLPWLAKEFDVPSVNKSN